MLYVGVDLGGTNIKVGLVNDEGKILLKLSIPTLADRKSDEVIADIGALVLKVIRDAGYKTSDIKAIGVGSPGAINSTLGIVDYSNNLHWHGVNLKDKLSAITGLDVKVCNDANVAALGEAMFGVGKNYSDSIMITLGTGVGGGIIIDKKLVEGNESKGAELGHCVIVVDGEQCSCGRKGCLEAYASATALIRMTKQAMLNNKDSKMWEYTPDIDKVDGRTSFETSKLGDKAAMEVVDTYVKFLSEGILNYGNIFRPQAFILGGGVCAQGDYLINKIKTYCAERDYGFKGCPKYDLLIATLGNDAGILGAASLVI